jgi:hypothetical protein
MFVTLQVLFNLFSLLFLCPLDVLSGVFPGRPGRHEFKDTKNQIFIARKTQLPSFFCHEDTKAQRKHKG